MTEGDSRRTWQEVRFYESRRALNRLAKERLGYELPGGQAEEILACFRLARDYYDAARVASLTVKPLLLFYGMTNLVRGLVVLCGGKERRRLKMIGQGHGLSFVQSSDNVLASFGCRVAERGTFVSFLDSFACDIRFEFPGIIDARLRNTAAKELRGKAFTLKELMGWIPELRMLFRRTFGLLQLIVRARISRDPIGGPCKIQFPGGAEIAEWGEIFGVGTLAVQTSQSDRTVWEITTPNTPLAAFKDWIEMADGGAGWPFYVEVTCELEPEHTRNLSGWAAQFAGMYVLAMVVRYQPTLWIEMTTGGRNSEILALVEAFVAYVEEAFPAKVLEGLERMRVVKGYVTTLDRLLVESLED